MKNPKTLKNTGNIADLPDDLTYVRFGDSKKNQFWSLFIGQSYHYIDINGMRMELQFHNLYGFEKIWKFIEKEYPEIWTGYLLSNLYKNLTVAEQFNQIVNLDNLLEFLLLPDQIEVWGWIECPNQAIFPDIANTVCNSDCQTQCFSKNKIWYRKHPALEYAEKEGVWEPHALTDLNLNI